MLDKDTIRKIRQIEISTRRLLTGSLVGDARSRIKGTGFEFDQIREYQQGDDIRFIDWSASARQNKLLVKEYIEERNRTIILAVDCSASNQFSSNEKLKSEVIAQVASVLALVANYGSDNVSLILFSDRVEKFIPAGRGRNHTRAIMEALFGFKPTRTKTNISCALEHAAKQKRKDGILFLISDFISNFSDTSDSDSANHGFEKSLSIIARMYDTVAIHCCDANEKELPEVGFLPVIDSETGELTIIDTRAKNQKVLQSMLDQRISDQQSLFKKYGVGCLEISNNQPFMGDLIRFFRRRMRY